MKLIIVDQGDPSVGIFSMVYTLETPVDKDTDSDDRKWFKKQISNLYQQFAEGRLTIDYEDELLEEGRYINSLGI